VNDRGDDRCAAASPKLWLRLAQFVLHATAVIPSGRYVKAFMSTFLHIAVQFSQLGTAVVENVMKNHPETSRHLPQPFMTVFFRR